MFEPFYKVAADFGAGGAIAFLGLMCSLGIMMALNGLNLIAIGAVVCLVMMSHLFGLAVFANAADSMPTISNLLSSGAITLGFGWLLATVYQTLKP